MSRLVLQPEGQAAPLGGLRVRESIEARFEEAQRSRAPFACYLVEVDGLDLVRRTQGEAVARGILAELAGAFASAPELRDSLGHSVEDRLLLAARVRRSEDVHGLAEALRDAARGCPIGGTARGPSLSVGIATNGSGALAYAPELLFDTLVEVAAEGVSVAVACGGDRAVHSELYELHQRRFERDAADRVRAWRARVEAPAEGALASIAPASGPTIVVPVPTPEPTDQVPERVPLSPVPLDPEDEEVAALRRRIRDALDAVDDGPGGRRRAEARLAELVLGERSLRRRDEGLTGEVDRLQRRIAKLKRALAELEARSAPGTEPVQGLEWGIAALPASGLSPADAAYERKRALMAAIFEANQDLLRAMRERRA